MQLKTASAIIIIGNLAWTASAQVRAHTHHTRELGSDCSQNEALVSKYGRQLCPDEIQEKFTSRSEFPAAAGFLSLEPRFKGFVVDFEEYNATGDNSLTWEEVQSVCVTECDKSPNCDLVCVEPKTNPIVGDTYVCTTFKPSKKPGGFMVDSPESFNITTYTKVGLSAGELYPPFVPCEVAISTLPTGIACLSNTTFSEDCSEIMTSDFFEYIVPAVFCLATAGDPAKVGECLTCLITANAGLLPICATDNSSVIRNSCKSQCYDEVEECEVKLQTSLLCVAGSQVEVAGFGGSITTDDYTCPDDI